MSHWAKTSAKIVSLNEANSISTEWKARGEQIVFSNGCFDILHQGHVVYLSKAADLGTKLIVGLNSDESVKRLAKGDDRPINDEHARALVLAALHCVDLVVQFNEDTPLSLIQSLNPTILVKGADYDSEELNPLSKKYIVGSKEVRASGGRICTIPLEEGFSTTNILNKVNKN